MKKRIQVWTVRPTIDTCPHTPAGSGKQPWKSPITLLALLVCENVTKSHTSRARHLVRSLSTTVAANLMAKSTPGSLPSMIPFGPPQSENMKPGLDRPSNNRHMPLHPRRERETALEVSDYPSGAAGVGKCDKISHQQRQTPCPKLVDHCCSQFHDQILARQPALDDPIGPSQCEKKIQVWNFRPTIDTCPYTPAGSGNSPGSLR